MEMCAAVLYSISTWLATLIVHNLKIATFYTLLIYYYYIKINLNEEVNFDKMIEKRCAGRF